MSKQSSLAVATVVAVLAAGALVSAQGRVMASATGSAHATINGSLRTFAFTVNRDASGTASGQLEVNNRDQGIRSHATLNCLNIVGNTAIISGQITDSTNPLLEDVYIWLKVVDNGQGSKAPPDKLTLAYFVGPEFTCDFDAAVPYMDLERGNVQIRP